MELLTTIGIASVISIIMNFFLDLYKKKHSLRLEMIINEKENRYRSILVFMSVVLDENNYKHISTQYKPEKETNIRDYYIEELKVHTKFSWLYAPRVVIQGLEDFISNPTEKKYNNVVTSMRKDLWGKRL